MRLRNLFKKKERILTLDEQVERTKTLEEAEDLSVFHVMDAFGYLYSTIAQYKYHKNLKDKTNPAYTESIEVINRGILHTKESVTVGFTCVISVAALIDSVNEKYGTKYGYGYDFIKEMIAKKNTTYNDLINTVLTDENEMSMPEDFFKDMTEFAAKYYDSFFNAKLADQKKLMEEMVTIFMDKYELIMPEA